MKSYLTFKEIPTTTKTKKFEVLSNTDGSKLGEIKWQPSYRSYALFVTSELDTNYADEIYADTKIFDTKCLTEITRFIEAFMAERKNV